MKSIKNLQNQFSRSFRIGSKDKKGGAGQAGNGELPPPRDNLNLTYTLADFSLLTTLGTGTFGRVRLVKDKKSANYYALKILKKVELIRMKQVDHIRSEITILGCIENPFIVNMIGFFQDERKLYMVLEFVQGGELFSLLRREGRFKNDQACFYAKQIVWAFAYLHSLNVIYRDLKPENLLIDSKGMMKITDFGFAKFCQDRTWTLCGTPEYLAPEIIQSKGHGKPVDWWALGVLIYEMLAGYPPFYDENPFGIYQKILGAKVEYPRYFTFNAKHLISKLLTHDRTKRLGCLKDGAKDIMSHKWFMKTVWDPEEMMQETPPHPPSIKGDEDTTHFDIYPDSVEDTSVALVGKEKEQFENIFMKKEVETTANGET